MHNPLRCEIFATFLDKGVDVIDIDRPATGRRVTAVADAVGLTRDDFEELDERPGQFRINGRSYTEAGSVWHIVLRIARNDPTSDLFNVLRDAPS